MPTQGIERWLTQRLSGHLGARPGAHDGVCANVRFPFPGTLISGALALASGTDPKADPWLPERAVWPLMEVVAEHFDEPWLSPLAQHIRNSETVQGSKRFSSIRHVADLFDRYAVHRPDMLQRWAAGRGRRGEAALAGPALAPVARPDRSRRARPSGWSSRASACGTNPRSSTCPRASPSSGSHVSPPATSTSSRPWPRGATCISSCCTPRPCSGTASPRASARRRASSPGRPTRRPARRATRCSRPGGATPGRCSWCWARPCPTATDEPTAVAPDASTLLRRIQDDVRLDRAPRGAGERRSDDARPLLDADDDSIRVHSCHGRGRQVEVLRDAILHLLDADPTLEPRDIIVMCPDIENFAPLIQATFGSHDLNDGGRLTPRARSRSAWPTARSARPTRSWASWRRSSSSRRLRMTATEVLDLAGREPVRRRFGFSDDDLFRLEEWVSGAFVRWGFDAAHRASFRLADIGSPTPGRRGSTGSCSAWPWPRRASGSSAASCRSTTSTAATSTSPGAWPSSWTASATRSTTWPGTRTVDAWADTLARISDSLTATTTRDAWQRSQLAALLEELVGEASMGGTVSPVELSCDDVRSILADRLRGRPTRANFCTGHLTVCTLVPMRSIPHRVVCLLGLDDGSFPRHIERDGDDLTARAPRGRRPRCAQRGSPAPARRAAARRATTSSITYSGRDERSNLPRPPAVPVGRAARRRRPHGAHAPTGAPATPSSCSTRSSPSTVATSYRGALVAGAPWSFDALHLAGAQAALTPRQAAPAFLGHPLEPYDSGPVGLDLVERFLRHPVRAFLRERLGISLRDKTRDFEDAIPVELDGLERWQVADRVLQAQLAGAEPGVVPRGRAGAWRPAAGEAGRRRARRPHRRAGRAGASPGRARSAPVSLEFAARSAGPARPGRHRRRACAATSCTP